MNSSEIRIRFIGEEGFAGLKIQPDQEASDWLLILHGYGGCKEEMLPLATFLAQKGLPALVIDLPGHGESDGLFDYTSTIECIDYWRKYVKEDFRAAIGHSLGGRLALWLDFPLNIAISPPLSATFTGGKTEMIRVLRPRRVKESAPFSGLIETLNKLGEKLSGNSHKKGLIVFAQHDLLAVKDTVTVAPPDYYEIKEIKHSDHHDILTSRQAWNKIWSWLAVRVNR